MASDLHQHLGRHPVRDPADHVADVLHQVVANPVAHEGVGGEETQSIVVLHRVQGADPGVELLGWKLSL